MAKKNADYNDHQAVKGDKIFLKTLIKKTKIALFGRLKVAVKGGLKCGKGVSVMSGVEFGSEPYLITLGDNVRISSFVSFITHDGGSWAFPPK